MKSWRFTSLLEEVNRGITEKINYHLEHNQEGKRQPTQSADAAQLTPCSSREPKGQD